MRKTLQNRARIDQLNPVSFFCGRAALSMMRESNDGPSSTFQSFLIDETNQTLAPLSNIKNLAHQFYLFSLFLSCVLSRISQPTM